MQVGIVWESMGICIYGLFLSQSFQDLLKQQEVQISIYSCLKEGPKSKDKHPEVGMIIWSSCICKYGPDQLRTGIVMPFPVLLTAIQAMKEQLLHHNTLKFGELEE